MRAQAIALRLICTVSIIAVLSSLGAVASPALAQDRKPSAAAKKTAAKTPAAVAKPAAAKKPPKPKKQVSTTDAVSLSTKMLVKHGFQVVRVEPLKDSQVIYYRAGNNGRGRGLGPVRKMIVRPYGNIVIFEAAPENVRLDIKLQLGFRPLRGTA